MPYLDANDLNPTAAGSRFPALPEVKLLANMTEFGRTPYLTAAEFQDLGYNMVIWPVSSLRMANKAQEDLYRHIAQTGETKRLLDWMQSRAELYQTLGLTDFDAFDHAIVETILPPDK